MTSFEPLTYDPATPRIDATTLQLWPEQAAKELASHGPGLDPQKLRRDFAVIYFPWDDAYSKFRVMFSLTTQELPLFVVIFTCHGECVKLLNLLADFQLTVRIVNGRHGDAIQNPKVYADISRLRTVELSSKDSILCAEGGATQGQVYQYLADLSLSSSSGEGKGKSKSTGRALYFPEGGMIGHGPGMLMGLAPRLAAMELSSVESKKHKRSDRGRRKLAGVASTLHEMFPGGTAGSVGVPGITTIGGLGSLKRTFGLTIDSVVSFEIALPPTRTKRSRIVEATKDHRSNLFWALRGGLGSNFGIVTRIRYSLPQIHQSIIYSVMIPFVNFHKALDVWQTTTPQHSNSFNDTLIYFLVNPTGTTPVEQTSITAGGVYVMAPGQSRKDAERDIQQGMTPLSVLSPDGLVMSSPYDYSTLVNTAASGRFWRPWSAVRVCLSNTLADSKFIKQQFKRAASIPGYHTFGIELLGGQIVTPSSSSLKCSNGGAFAGRDRQFMFDVLSWFDSALDACANETWTRQTMEGLFHPDDKDILYMGFPENGVPQSYFYQDSLPGLLMVKNQIDPLRVLTFPTGLSDAPSLDSGD